MLLIWQSLYGKVAYTYHLAFPVSRNALRCTSKRTTVFFFFLNFPLPLNPRSCSSQEGYGKRQLKSSVWLIHVILCPCFVTWCFKYNILDRPMRYCDSGVRCHMLSFAYQRNFFIMHNIYTGSCMCSFITSKLFIIYVLMSLLLLLVVVFFWLPCLFLTISSVSLLSY